MYLGSELFNMTNVDGQECWDMYFNKYCTAAVANVVYLLEKRGLRFPSIFFTPLRCGYCSDNDGNE